MNYLQLIEKLREYSPQDPAHFYCPVDRAKGYYYVVKLSIHPKSYQIYISQNPQVEPMNYERLIARISDYILFYPYNAVATIVIRDYVEFSLQQDDSGGHFAVCDTQ
jgi:hypothetical protein